MYSDLVDISGQSIAELASSSTCSRSVSLAAPSTADRSGIPNRRSIPAADDSLGGWSGLDDSSTGIQKCPIVFWGQKKVPQWGTCVVGELLCTFFCVCVFFLAESKQLE